MAVHYLHELYKELSRSTLPEFSQGASGYFSPPASVLDPALFRGEQVKPEIRAWLFDTLFRFWSRRGFQRPRSWSTVWIAGSGASYQWQADRGNGDLDILIGVDWPAFYAANPDWSHLGVDDLTTHLDQQLRQELWPTTARTSMGGKEFEVTYFVNANASDIRTIHPYAAYNLTADEWTVRPSRHTAHEDPGPAEWAQWGQRDLHQAQELRERIVQLLAQAAHETHGPRLLNLFTALSRATDEAVALLEDIHTGRRTAFSASGRGYWDYTNWRWQTAKQNGLVTVLAALEQARKRATDDTQKLLYGQSLPDASSLALRAALGHRRGI